MSLINDIGDIEKTDGICLLIFVVDDLLGLFCIYQSLLLKIYDSISKKLCFIRFTVFLNLNKDGFFQGSFFSRRVG